MSDWVVAGVAFVVGFGVGMAVLTLAFGRWVWRQFQEQRKKTASGEGFPKPGPFVKN